MKFEEIKQWLEENKGNEEVKGYLDRFKVEKEVSLELFKEKLLTDSDFKSYLDSEKDKHYSKALETWKANNLEKLINEKVKEMYPEADPKDLELQKLQQEVENMKKETLRKELTNVALKQATERGLPSDLIDYFVGNDEEATLNNLSKLEEVFNRKLEITVKDRLKGEGYAPPKSSGDLKTVTKDEFMKMDFIEQQEFAKENPDAYKEIMD